MRATTDLDGLGLDDGGHLLVDRALAALPPGGRLTVTGRHPALRVHLAAWCREHGHRLAADAETSADGGENTGPGDPVEIIKGTADEQRWRGASGPGRPTARRTNAPTRAGAWPPAARSSKPAARPSAPNGPNASTSGPTSPRGCTRPRPPASGTPRRRSTGPPHVDVPNEIERAVVQLMTYLVENEQAALIIPARLLSQLHPHFREVMQLLATQAADEARHVEVFTRRGLLSGGPLGTSSAGGRASLQTLLAEPDFTTASFLLSVLGEGTFLDLLRFLHRNAPDPVTADVARLAVRDEARHVAFGVAHTAHLVATDKSYLGVLRQSVERRHAALLDTAGLNTEVFDSLVLLAAGSWEPAAISRGWRAVRDLQASMDEGRRRRLAYIGFPDDEAAELSALHTRNFM